MKRPTVRVLLLAGAVAGALTLSACSSQPASNPTTADASIVMTSPTHGFAIWPSDARWIVLGTSDAWHTVANRTPIAVPTDGGLALAATPAGLVVGVRAYKLLTTSPVLVSNDDGRTWSPIQLPGALANGPDVVTRTHGWLWSVLRGGRVLGRNLATNSWVTSAAATFGSDFTPTGVSSPDGTTVFVTGSRRSNGPVAFVSTDDGRTWLPVRDPSGQPTPSTTTAVCKVGARWVLPELSATRANVLLAVAPTGPWTAAAPVAGLTEPGVGCANGSAWLRDRTSSRTSLRQLTLSGTWTKPVTTSESLLQAVPMGEGSGVAVGTDASALIRVDLGPPLLTTSDPWPSWVATIGGPAMRN